MRGQTVVPPLPEGFARVFVEHGWRGIERMYGASSVVLNAWIAAAGGQALRAERQARQATGRKCGAWG